MKLIAKAIIFLAQSPANQWVTFDPWHMVAPQHPAPRINGYRQAISVYEIFRFMKLFISLLGF